MRFYIFLLFLPFMILASCTEAEYVSHLAKTIPGQSQSEGKFKVGSPYQVAGKWYTPRESYNFTETGIASWYGPQFHGKSTANGEIFDKNELTAAHRTLQLPSLVRVTNLENGRSLIVRVNDRGPFKRGRIIDLSQKAAELLGFKNRGTARVKIQVLTQESLRIAEAAKRGEDTRGIEVAMNEGRYRPTPAARVITPEERSYQTASVTSVPAPVEKEVLSETNIPGHLRNGNFMPDPVVKQVPVSPTNIYVQFGSFTKQDNALRLAGSLKNLGHSQVQPAVVNGTQFYRVRIGPIHSVEQADATLERAIQAGQQQAIIVVD